MSAEAGERRTLAAPRSSTPTFGFLLAACSLAACSPPPGPTRGPGPDLGYVQWITRRPWTLDDLPAVAASYDELCRRADAGDAEATRLRDAAGPSLWLARALLLPALRVLPGADDVPADGTLAAACPAPPPGPLAAALAEFAAGEDREHAIERLLAVEYQGGATGTADEARLARILVGVALAFPLTDLGPTPALVAALATLDPDDELVLAPVDAGGPCLDAPGAPACLWRRLAAQALHDSDGAESVDLGTLEPAARDTLARRGFLNVVARDLLPVAEDPGASLRLLAAELAARLREALGVGDSDAHTGDDPAEPAPEGDFPDPEA